MPIYSVNESKSQSTEVVTEKVNMTFALTPLNDIPKDYYKVAGKLFQTIKDETKGKVGEGPGDAAFNAAFSNKTKEDIEKDTNKNAFVFIIPKKLKLSMYFTTPREWREFADGILKKCGFTKGATDTVMTNTYYWYKYSPDKKHMYVVFYMCPSMGYIPATYQMQMSIRCVINNEKNKFVRESAPVSGINKSDDFEKHQKMVLGSLFSPLDDSDLAANSITAEMRKYIPYPQLERAFVEAFDYKDRYTRRSIMAMTEAEHNKVLTDLTSKLYDKIVTKANNIDFGEIPKTKGDIAKLSNFEEMMDTLKILKGIVTEYKQDSKPVDEISVAISNIQGRKDLFERGFRYDCEMVMLMYDDMVMAIVSGISFLIASCIEFIKAPRDESFSIQLNKVAYSKSKDGLLYSSIAKFNKSCENGDFDKAMQMIIDKRIKKFSGVTIAASIAAGVIILTNIIPIMRELTFLFYYNRVKVSDFFAMQADLLTMNAYNLQHNSTMDPAERDDIVEKQMAIATKFRNISNKFNIEEKQAEVKATRDIENNNKKYKLDDEANVVVDDESEDSDSSVLF